MEEFHKNQEWQDENENKEMKESEDESEKPITETKIRTSDKDEQLPENEVDDEDENKTRIKRKKELVEEMTKIKQELEMAKIKAEESTTELVQIKNQMKPKDNIVKDLQNSICKQQKEIQEARKERNETP